MLYRVYIDEAGDRGASEGSSDYFVVSAVIVADQHDAATRNRLAEIRELLGRDRNHVLHFRKLKHVPKVRACMEVANLDNACVTNVILCKRRLQAKLPDGSGAHIKNPDPMYLYAIRLLLERISWFIDDAGASNKAIVTLGHITRFKSEKLHEYRANLEFLSDTNEIRWDVFAGHPFRLAATNEVELLQLADIAASALFAAIDPGKLGITERRYLDELAPLIYRRRGNVMSYGLKVLPDDEGNRGGALGFLREYQ